MTDIVSTNSDEYRQGILRRNFSVSREVVAQSERLESELSKLGVDFRPRYSLSPPLGDSVRQLHNHSRRTPV
jgi:hypothetical protein